MFGLTGRLFLAQSDCHLPKKSLVKPMANDKQENTKSPIELFKSEGFKLITSVIGAVVTTIVISQIEPVKQFFVQPFETNLLIMTIAVILFVIITFFGLKRHYATVEEQYKQKLQQIKVEHEQRIQQLYEELKIVKDNASRDPFTGAYKKDELPRLLDERITEAEANNKTFSLIFIDIDHFKRINDEHTHIIGDFVLSQFGDVIRPRSKDDILLRFGGDEFLIISKLGTDAKGGYGFAERLRREIKEYKFLVEDNSTEREELTISCGVTDFVLGQDNQKKLFARAADALHMAKQPRVNKNGSSARGNFVFVKTEAGS